MTNYNYWKETRDNVLEYIYENYNLEDYDGIEELREALFNDDNLCIDDSITGNASGSYYCNAWKAEEALAHNLDLLEEAAEAFGSDLNKELKSAEGCDVLIRCYCLNQAIIDATDELEAIDEHFAHMEEDDDE